MKSQELRTLIGEKIEARWSDWAPRHPHLAEAIDRVRLIEYAVHRLREDPAFVAAMREADLDEAGLIKVSHLLERAEALIHHILPI
jgi:hypothetical protein